MDLSAFPDIPWSIAHRGASQEFPENTMTAFDAALEEGCDGIELDLQLSRDGVPVVYHDRTLRKIGGGSRGVRAVDWVEIAALDAGQWHHSRYAGEPVPTLDLVLDRYGSSTRLLLELKVHPGDKRTGQHLRLIDAFTTGLQRRHHAQVMVLCFDLETLDRVRERVPDLPIVLNLRAPAQMTGSLARAVHRVSALSVDVSTLSPDVVTAVHDAGKPVLTYTCNTTAAVRRALEARVDGIMSDRPRWLRHMLATLA